MDLKNIFQIYTLLVCLVSTIILMISAYMFLNATTDLLFPQYKHYSSLLRYESNESYLRSLNSYNDREYKEIKPLPPRDIEVKRNEARINFLEKQKGSAIENIILTLQWALVGFIFFIIHWRLYTRSKKVVG